MLQKQLETKGYNYPHIRFTKSILNGKALVLAQTGVGKVNVAIITTLMTENFKPHEIIFSGKAGGVDTTLSPGDIVIATQVAYHDCGTVTDTGIRYNLIRNGVTRQLNIS